MCPAISATPLRVHRISTTRELVESFRDETGRPRQRTISTLGRLDEVGRQVDALLKGLLRAKGMPASMADAPQLAFESALALGDVWTLPY